MGMDRITTSEMVVHGIKTGIVARVREYNGDGMFLGFKCGRCGKEFGRDIDDGGWHWWNARSERAVMFHYEHCQGG